MHPIGIFGPTVWTSVLAWQVAHGKTDPQFAAMTCILWGVSIWEASRESIKPPFPEPTGERRARVEGQGLTV